jgi:hypothetical protein
MPVNAQSNGWVAGCSQADVNGTVFQVYYYVLACADLQLSGFVSTVVTTPPTGICFSNLQPFPWVPVRTSLECGPPFFVEFHIGGGNFDVTFHA